jgi:hypothetical protein
LSVWQQGGGPGGYLLLGTAAQHSQQQQQQQRHAAEQQGMPPALSPNSTPGIQMPAPPATPPIMGLDDRSMYLGGMGRMMQPGQQQQMDKYGMEGGEDVAWKGMQGGILADMFPSMEPRHQQQIHHPFHDPRLQAGQNMTQAQAMAQLQVTRTKGSLFKLRYSLRLLISVRIFISARHDRITFFKDLVAVCHSFDLFFFCYHESD